MTADERATKIAAYVGESVRAYTEFFDKYSSDVLSRAAELWPRRSGS